MPSIEDVTRPWVGLAGVRIDTTVPAAKRSNFGSSITVRDRAGGIEHQLELPDRARIADVRWSHDSRRFAFTRFGEESIELWVADTTHAEAERVARGLNCVLGTGFGWMPDGEHLWCLLFPAEHPEAPRRPAVPRGPAVQETAGARSPLRTYTNLLGDPFDEELFAHYASAQLALVGAVNGEVRRVGASGVAEQRGALTRRAALPGPAARAAVLPTSCRTAVSPTRSRSGARTVSSSTSWPTFPWRRTSPSGACARPPQRAMEGERRCLSGLDRGPRWR